MKKLRYILHFFVVCAFFISCKKNKEPDPVTFSGKITDDVQAINVSGAKVYLAVQSSANNSVFNSGFSTVATTYTNASGNYSMTVSPENAVQYKVIVEKDNYFGKEKLYNASSIPAGSTTTSDFVIDPFGWFKVTIKNTNPFDANDNIIFQNTSEASGCSSCCTNSPVNFIGMNVDTFLICKRVAYPTVSFAWFITKNGNLTSFSNSVSVVIGDTAVYNLTY